MQAATRNLAGSGIDWTRFEYAQQALCIAHLVARDQELGAGMAAAVRPKHPVPQEECKSSWSDHREVQDDALELISQIILTR